MGSNASATAALRSHEALDEIVERADAALYEARALRTAPTPDHGDEGRLRHLMAGATRCPPGSQETAM